MAKRNAQALPQTGDQDDHAQALLGASPIGLAAFGFESRKQRA